MLLQKREKLGSRRHRSLQPKLELHKRERRTAVEESRFEALDCDLAKCLVLCAKLTKNELLSETESLQVKRFLLSVQDTATLNHMVRVYE